MQRMYCKICKGLVETLLTKLVYYMSPVLWEIDSVSLLTNLERLLDLLSETIRGGGRGRDSPVLWLWSSYCGGARNIRKYVISVYFGPI